MKVTFTHRFALLAVALVSIVTLASPLTRVIQGIKFQAWALSSAAGSAPSNPSVTVSSHGSYNSFPTLYSGGGATGNDLAMGQVLSTGFFLSSTSLTMTLGGLTPANSYRVDLFVQSNNDVRVGTYTFAGATTESSLAVRVTQTSSAGSLAHPGTGSAGARRTTASGSARTRSVGRVSARSRPGVRA